MAATLTTAPPDIALAGNDIWVELTTDQVSADTAARVDLDFTATGPSTGEVFALFWPGQSVTFTVAATTNSTATAIPEKDGGETLAEYAARVADALRENGTLTASWTVLFLGTAGAAERVRLVYQSAETLAITTNVTGVLSNTTITLTDGTPAELQTNLAAMLQVWQVGANAAGNDDELLATLHAPYASPAGITQFNLQGLFPVAPALPASNTIKAHVVSVWPHGEVPGAWAKYFLRYADKYGLPAVPEALLKSSTYYALHGANPGNHTAPGSVGFVLSRHGYRYIQGSTYVNFRKPVTLLQPDWLYLWVKTGLTGCKVEHDVTWTDGTIQTITNALSNFTLDANKMYYFATGPLHTGIGALTPPSAGAEVWYYTWRLRGNAGLGEANVYAQDYQVYDCTDWDTFLLLDNGLGGQESVALRGKTTRKYAATRETLRRSRTQDFSPTIGDLFTTSVEGQQGFDCNTGWYPRYYIEHLRQLLLGDVWIIDTGLERFLRMVVDTESVQVSKDDEQLYSLSFNMKAAWVDGGINI